MTDDASQQPAREGRPRSGVLLMLGALGLIVVPVIIGLIAIRSNDNPSLPAGTTQDGMGGDSGMGGATPATSSAALPAGVRDFATIQDGDIVIEEDPSGGGAILRVRTTIDVACAVAYGPTDALGNLATDTDMAGGGHSDHSPLMRGLSPGVTYRYRLAGIGPDGGLYLSDLMEFTYTGEAAPEAQPPAPNVAVGAAVVEVSSAFSDAYAGANAVDGDLATEWSSNGDGDDAYIEIDLGGPHDVKGVGFRTRSMTDGTSITTSFTITVDGTATYGPFEAGPGLSIALVEFNGQVIRFDVDTSTGGNTGAIEVEVYGISTAGEDEDM